MRALRPPRLRPPPLGGQLHAPLAALATGLGIDAALAAADAANGSSAVAVGGFLLGPLVASLLGGWRETALVGAVALALALVSGAWNGDFASVGYVARALLVAAASTLATLGAGARISTNASLARFELLAAIAEVGDRTRTLAETVERVLDLVVPAFADVATIDASDGPGALRHVGARVTGSGRAQLEAMLMRRRQQPPGRPIGVRFAAERHESQLIESLSNADLSGIAADESDLELVSELGIRSAIFLPLRARGETIGTLGCAVGSSGRRYDERDRRFAEVLAGRVALVLDNAGLSEEVTSLERRLEATLTNLAEAVTVQDRDGRTVYANPAAVRLLRVGSTDEVTAAGPGELIARYDVTTEDGRRVCGDDLPGARVLRGEDPEPLLVRNVVRATGEERWLLTKATAVRRADGAVALAVNVIEDITEVKRAELRQRLLARAGRALSSSLDYERTLQQVAQIAVPDVADWCVVTMPGDGRALRQVAVAHVDPDRVELARESASRYAANVSDAGGVAQVMRTNQPTMVTAIADELLVAAAHDEQHLELLRGLGMRSVIIVPLDTGGAAIGALSLVMADSGRVFADEDLALAQELGRRAATAVENARLYTERSEIAETLQRSLLPPELPAVSGWTMASLYRAAGDHNEVGGDFYDAFDVPGGMMVVVGDVAGRGAAAAALTSLARYTLRTAGQLLGDPLGAAKRLNKALREQHELSLVSVCCVMLRERGEAAEAEVVLAGHPPPYLVRHGVARELGSFAPFLGAFDIGTWRAVKLDLERGDLLVLYTDGVIDTVGEDARFGEERLTETIARATDPDETIQLLDSALSQFARGPQRDDTAVLVVQRTGGGELRSGAASRVERLESLGAGEVTNGDGRTRKRDE